MPENHGNAVGYTGARTHRPLPSATQKGYRAAHQPQEPKTSTFNWDWNKADCTGCQTKIPKATLADGLCRTCRGEAETLPPAPREAYSYDEGELDTIYRPEQALPDVDDEDLADGPDEEPDTAVAAASVDLEDLEEAEHQAETVTEPAPIARELRAPSRRPVHDPGLLEQIIEHTESTLRAAHGIEDPIVGILRTAALSAIAALDFYVALHCTTSTDSRGTAEPPTDGAASTTNPAPSPGLGGTQPAADPRGEARPRPVRVNGPRGVRRPAVEVDETAVVRQYVEDQDSGPTIARRHGVLPKRIRQILRAHGVELRDDRHTKSGGGNRRVWDQDALDDVVRRYAEGQTIEQIAREVVAGRRQVAQALRDAGVTLRRPVSDAKPIDEETRAEIVRRYVDQEQTLNVISEAVHLRVARVKAVVVEAGHQVRPHGGAHTEILGRLAGLGVTPLEVKGWAVEQGLIPVIVRGMVPARLVEAYAAAHRTEGPGE